MGDSRAGQFASRTRWQRPVPLRAPASARRVAPPIPAAGCPSPVASQRTAAASCTGRQRARTAWPCAASLISREFSKKQLRAVVPDARANLPSDQRILIRGIVADQQHSLGFVQLLHRQRGIGGAIAERGDESGVIRGAVMIDVVGAKRGARQPLEQIIFFVRGAVGADEADGIRAVRA